MNVRCLLGSAALSSFRIDKIQQSLAELWSGLRLHSARHVYFAEIRSELARSNGSRFAICLVTLNKSCCPINLKPYW